MKRGRRRPHYQKGGVLGFWGVFVWFMLAPSAVLIVGPLMLDERGAFLVPIVVASALLATWPIARYVLVPLGRVRLAYWFAYASDFPFRRDRRGGALLAGALALARQHVRDGADADWILGKIAVEAPLRGASLLASGILLAALDDLEGARVLIEGVIRRRGADGGRVVRRLATAWLAALAATRGDWTTVAELGRTLDRGGRATWLLSGAAEVLLREPTAPGPTGLWLRWALAPRRRQTFSLLRSTLSSLDVPVVPVVGPEDDARVVPAEPAREARAASDPLDTALALHASTLRRPAQELRAKDLRLLAQAWDTALDDRATLRWLSERAVELGQVDPAAVLARTRRVVEHDIAMMAFAGEVRLATRHDMRGTLGRAQAHLRDLLLSDIEAASEAIRRRVDKGVKLAIADERREWMALRSIYERGIELAGADFRRVAYAAACPECCNFAVWLADDRDARRMANTIFRWLLVEAEAVGDADAADVHRESIRRTG